MSTDKYYDTDRAASDAAVTSIYSALRQTTDRHHLTVEDVNALAHILAYAKRSGDTTHYEHAVDFLWMAFRIEYSHKAALLDLT